MAPRLEPLLNWYTTPVEELEHQYSPSRWAAKPIEEHLADYAALSEPWVDRDLVVAGQPLLVYIHGGYWQALSARESLFMAPDAVSSGISLHAVDYPLAPAASLRAIIEYCVSDVVSVLQRAEAPRVVIAGSSAGAHLAVMCALDERLMGVADCLCLLSGVYDIRSLVRTYINAALGLTSGGSAGINPSLAHLDGLAKCAVVAVGEHESPEFGAQSAHFIWSLRDAEVPTASTVVQGRDHFDLPYDVLRAGTTVGDHVLAHLLG